MSDRVPTVAVAASRASRGMEETNAVPPAAAPSARKRGKHIHETQVLADFFSDQDLPKGHTPPTDLIAKMSASDLYEDVYKEKIDVSFDSLPTETKDRMLGELQALAPKVLSHAVRASADDPTAIIIPPDHRHDTILIPSTSLANDDPLVGVKDGHHAELCTLHAYDVIEDFARAIKFAGAAKHMTLRKLVTALRACAIHSLFQPSGNMAYLIFELEERQVFFVALGVTGCGSRGERDEYAPWTSVLLEEIGETTVEIGDHVFFECPCV